MSENGTPTTGPMMPPSKPYVHDMRRFNLLMDSLSIWRSEDHEDATWLSRNQIIEIIEGVKQLRRDAA